MQAQRQAVKLSSRGGGRATDESGAWKLHTAQNSLSTEDELYDALLSAQQHIESLEQDVLALEFVAEHHALEDICDLDMHYSNPHLEVRLHCHSFMPDKHANVMPELDIWMPLRAAICVSVSVMLGALGLAQRVC